MVATSPLADSRSATNALALSPTLRVGHHHHHALADRRRRVGHAAHDRRRLAQQFLEHGDADAGGDAEEGRAAGREPGIAGTTSRITCGFTAKITSTGAMSAGRSAALAAVTAPSFAARSRSSAFGSTTKTSAGASLPDFSQPDSMAKPILPQPARTTITDMSILQKGFDIDGSGGRWKVACYSAGCERMGKRATSRRPSSAEHEEQPDRVGAPEEEGFEEGVERGEQHDHHEEIAEKDVLLERAGCACSRAAARSGR